MSQYIYMIYHAVCHYDSQIPSFGGGDNVQAQILKRNICGLSAEV